ncbi:extracellular solute-binding protein [Streptomyces sp. NPDC060030]|uniref:extracellular solute-binding protein n=1 Tax=Streptomyces sp. NPDC060030 TaxID=3347042 RepID=UPI00368B641F
MSTSSQLLSRRSFGRLAAGVAGAAGTGALSACTTGGGRPSADTPLRIMAINHVWSQAVRRRTKEFEERMGRRVSMTLLTADQLASSYNVKLNASGTDVDVMMVRALQEQLLFTHNGWLTDLSDRVAQDEDFAWPDFQKAPRDASVSGGKVLSVPVVTERPALYYRKDLVEDHGGPPPTLEQLMATAQELTDKRKGFYGFVGRGQRSGAVSQWSSVEEAARTDGLSAFGAFRRIALPLAAPGTATASLVAFVFSWNNFMFALIFADDRTQTVPVTLFNFISYAGTDWGGLMAAATLITVPVVLAAVLGQKYLVAGLTSGATKG